MDTGETDRRLSLRNIPCGKELEERDKAKKSVFLDVSQTKETLTGTTPLALSRRATFFSLQNSPFPLLIVCTGGRTSVRCHQNSGIDLFPISIGIGNIALLWTWDISFKIAVIFCRPIRSTEIFVQIWNHRIDQPRNIKFRLSTEACGNKQRRLNND